MNNELSVTVAHLPKRLSPTYRNRVHNLSPRNRNKSVKHEPEKHNEFGYFIGLLRPPSANPEPK